MTFEENLEYKDDIPLVTYIDFEITVPTDECLDPENIKMFAVSYGIIFEFHSELDIERVIIERKRVTSLNYLTREQIEFNDSKTLLQLRDCALAAAERKIKIEISEMFSTELKFPADCLLK